MSTKTIALLAALVGGTTVASMYVGAALFFRDSFFFGTSIGNFDIGGCTVEGAKAAIANRGSETNLSLYGRGAKRQVIKGKDIDLNYEVKEDLSEFKEKQSPMLWPLAIFSDNSFDVTESITYDEEKLDEIVDQLTYFEESNIIQPQDAEVVFNGNEYVVVPEKEGRLLNKVKLKEEIIEALAEGKVAIDLDEEQCYERPKYTRESPEIVKAQELINASLYSDVVYLFGEVEERVSPQMLSEWLEVGDDTEIIVNEEKIDEYIAGLAEKYNTLGVTRSFRTSQGNMVEVYGGDYGWSIDQKAEKQALIEAVTTGGKIYREPIANPYGAQSYVDTDLGNSYVEIDLSSQYLWFYKDGQLMVEGDVVTGDRSRRRETPQGTYKLDYKQRNATLRGPGYATPVSFWMPFNGGIGIHDATWRGSFGGKIYVSNGSHGCVNVPYKMAQIIFNNIDQTMPIVCHY